MNKKCWRVSIFSRGGMGGGCEIGDDCGLQVKGGLGTIMPSLQWSHMMGMCFEWSRAAVGSVLH